MDTLEKFQQELEIKFNNLDSSDIKQLLSDVKHYLKNEYDKYNKLNDESGFVFQIAKSVEEVNRITFKQWKALNFYVTKQNRNKLSKQF